MFETHSLKFIYSEKATKFCEISTLLLTGTTQDKSKVDILQNFVAFSEYMNFNLVGIIWSPLLEQVDVPKTALALYVFKSLINGALSFFYLSILSSVISYIFVPKQDARSDKNADK